MKNLHGIMKYDYCLVVKSWFRRLKSGNEKRKQFGADGIARGEVKFCDLRRTNKCESIQQECVFSVKNQVGGSEDD
jgi:hypothetical protein